MQSSLAASGLILAVSSLHSSPVPVGLISNSGGAWPTDYTLTMNDALSIAAKVFAQIKAWQIREMR